MRKGWVGVVIVASSVVGCASAAPPSVSSETARYSRIVELPDPDRSGHDTVEQALSGRRSAREFAVRELPETVVGQLLWAGQGITDAAGHRTAPSAGAIYPLELYVVTATSLGHYVPEGHRLEVRTAAPTPTELADAAFDQQFVGTAPAVFVITGVRSRTEEKYGSLAGELMNREAGHVAQNILLQATGLDLAAVPVGGFDPALLARLLALPPGEEVLYLLPIGYPSQTGDP